MMKIGAAGRESGVSVQAIRLYEAEGLLISFRSKAGTRWYSERDVQWILRIKGLLSKGLNFEGIRRLLAQIPCWALRPCTPALHSACSMHHQNRLPCWTDPEKLCPEKLRECYHCNAYGRAREFVNLKAHAEIVSIR
jgi:MerR family transcriptional regulator/heat shock protein HspR